MAEADRICAVPDCGKKHYSKGFCVAHLRKVEKYGDPLAGGTNLPRGQPCIVNGCTKPSVRRGYCAMHNKRLIRHGSIDGGHWVEGEREKWLLAHVDFGSDECLIWPFRVEPNGYGSLYWDGATAGAHRVMCSLAHGEPGDRDLQTAHSCNNRRCVNPRHLRWATAQENTLEKNDHGTMLVGERNPQHVLTEDDVLAIRTYEGKAFLREVAPLFGVSMSTVHRIWQRKAWGWLPEVSAPK